MATKAMDEWFGVSRRHDDKRVDAERRQTERDRRATARSGRRRTDARYSPWWRRGAVLSAVCVVLRCWQWFTRKNRGTSNVSE